MVASEVSGTQSRLHQSLSALIRFAVYLFDSHAPSTMPGFGLSAAPGVSHPSTIVTYDNVKTEFDEDKRIGAEKLIKSFVVETL